MEMPHEIIVWYLLPALRKALVVELKSSKMSQKAIAKKMNITEAAVSQYLHNKRGSKEIKLGNALNKEVKRSALKIMDDKTKNISAIELIRLVHIANREKIVCTRCTLKHGYCDICTRVINS